VNFDIVEIVSTGMPQPKAALRRNQPVAVDGEQFDFLADLMADVGDVHDTERQ
jgi:hypothetical protein